MRLFLDTSTILAACGSSSGASRELIRLASLNGWHLLITPCVEIEVIRNLPSLGPHASDEWTSILALLHFMPDVFSLDRPAVFPVAKDRPVLFSALAWADVLLTLDRDDFATLLGKEFYGMPILKPGDFLQRELSGGKLKIA
jgi:predicted nucleic acid-binding protein